MGMLSPFESIKFGNVPVPALSHGHGNCHSNNVPLVGQDVPSHEGIPP